MSSVVENQLNNLNLNQNQNQNELSIPLNKGSKVYKLNEAVNIYYQNKEFLNNLNFPGNDFKNSTPKDIIHFNKFDKLDQLNDTSSNQIDTQNTSSQFIDVKSQPSAQPHNHPLNQSQPQPQTFTEDDDISIKMISPENLVWYYLDSMNNEQGPFTSTQMQNWFNDGYLNLELMIKYNNSKFLKLKEICQLGSFSKPFDVSLPEPSLNQSLKPTSSLLNNNLSNNLNLNYDLNLNYYPLMNNMNSNINGLNTNLNTNLNNNLNNNLNTNLNSNLLNNNLNNNLNINNFNNYNNSNINYMNQNLNLNTNLNYSNLINPLSRTNSSWGVDYSSPSTPLAQLENPLNNSNQALNMGQPLNMNQPLNVNQPLNNLHQPLNNLNNLNMGIQPPLSPWSTPVANSPFITTQNSNSNSESIMDEKVSTNSLDNDEINIQNDEIPIKAHEFENITQDEIIQPNVIKGEIVEEIVQPNVIKVEQEEIIQPKVVKIEEEIVQPKVVKIEQEITQPKVSKPETPKKKEVKEEKKKLVTEIKKDDKKDEKVDNKAPWANVNTVNGSKLSLKDIQRIENEKFLKQKQSENEFKSENTNFLIQEIEKQERQKELERSEKVLPSTWGSSNTSIQKPVKTLLEIQEEERKASELVKKAKQSTIASTLSSAPTVDNSWTTVVNNNKKPITAKPSAFQISNSRTVTDPSKLRSISANNLVSDNSMKQRIEFASWAKSQMVNLYPSVSTNDLLEMFISLPNNQDSNQLISETIYSSSTTMNGRVFASDFLKKRGIVDRAVGSDLTEWSRAIIESGEVEKVEDGWSTSTKPKKKGKKN